MKALKQLPNGYRKALQLDLEANKSLRIKISAAAVLVCLFMGIYGDSIQPIERYFRGSLNQVAYAFLGIILYMILHEMVHGLFMWIFGRSPARFGLSMPFTCARSEIYFSKLQYIIIALAPVVIWGLVLWALCRYNLKTDWFWTFYFIEMVNLSGAVSDIYVAFKFLDLSRDVLVRDEGPAINVYVKG